MEVGLRSLVLRSGCVFDDVGGMEDWASGGQVGFDLMLAEAARDLWMAGPWWKACDLGCQI